jgi:hypothetical protein
VPDKRATTTTLGDRCDFGQIIKVYTNADPEGQRRYSPPDVSHTEKVPVMGNPAPEKICTPHIGRQNLTIRMSMRRLTRLTDAFSQKVGQPVGRVLPALLLLQLSPKPMMLSACSTRIILTSLTHE